MGRGEGKSGQAAMEYLIITAIAFMLLIPIVLIAYTQSARFSDDVAGAQAQKIGQEMVDAAHEVWYAGPPAKTTRTLYFPDGIQAISINGQSIVFTISSTGGAYEYAAFADTNLTGSIAPFKGLHTIVIEATQDGPVNITEG